MKQTLIESIREVPISGKTYEEYVEAVADKLIAEDYRKASDVADNIIKDLENFADDNKKEILVYGHGVWFINLDDLTEFIAELKEEYTEGGK